MDFNAPDSSTCTPASADLIEIIQKVFKNDLILKEIIQNLNNSMDLANCRLVNKESWKRLATQRLQMKNWEERNFRGFSSAEKVQKYCETYANTKVSDLSTVLFPCLKISYGGAPTSTPEAKIITLETICRTFPQKIKSLDLKMGSVPLTPQLLDPLFQSQSSSLRELKIQCPVRGNLSFARPQVLSRNYLLENLRYLCLTGDEFCISVIEAPFQNTFLDLICSKIPPGNPNSVKICLMEWNSPMTETISVLTHYQLISSLKILRIEAIRSGDCQILAESGVQLEFLAIVPYGEYPGLTHEVCQFLQSQSNLLEMFEWSGESFEFPASALNLRKIRLDSIKDHRDDEGQEGVIPLPVQHIPILYGQRFPKLEFLELLSLSYLLQPLPDFHSMFLAPQCPCANLQILKLRNSRSNAETINLISEIFPRLKKLDVGQYNNEEGFGPDDEQTFYSALWSANFASTLEEFAIDLDSQSNQGQPRERLWNQFELESFFAGLNIDQIQQLDFSSGEHYQIQNSSILNFSKLKKLEIFALEHEKTPGACFTDFSAFTLFGQLKYLEYLHVDEKVHEFTEAAIEFLRMRHENNVKILSDDVYYTSIERIENAFCTDWNSTNMDDHERTGSNLLKGK